MTNYTPTVAVHATLTPATVDKITFPASQYAFFEIYNRDASGVIWLRGDHVDPVALAADNFVIAAGQSLVIPATDSTTWATGAEWRLISATACPYSVTGI